MKNIVMLTALVSLFSLNLSAQVCVSHRALSYGGAENTKEAIRSALRSSVKAIEVDIVHTKDGKSLIYHDTKLERFLSGANCPIGKKVKSQTFEQIVSSCRVDGQKFQSLAEVLDMASSTNKVLFLEFKDSISIQDMNEIEKIYKDRADRIVIISFNKCILKKVKKHRKKSDFYKKVKLLVLKDNGNKTEFMTQYDGVDVKKLSSSSLNYYRRKNMTVAVYTKNTIEEISHFAKMGVDYITTDFPKRCHQVLKSLKGK